MNVKSPEIVAVNNPEKDKNMGDILRKYKKAMNQGQLSKENLFLKKIRYQHPIFRDISYNSYKMIFDLCQLV